MKKFEYKVVTADFPLQNDDLKKENLDKFGEDGWELVIERVTVIFPSQSYWIFKREIL